MNGLQTGVAEKKKWLIIEVSSKKTEATTARNQDLTVYITDTLPKDAFQDLFPVGNLPISIAHCQLPNVTAELLSGNGN